MGLASVEVLMAIEDRFDIVITDEEAIQVRTVHDVFELIRRKLHFPPADVCPSSHLFFQTRRALVNQYGIERKAVTLDSPLEEFIPLTQRKKEWRRFGQTIALTLPTLEAPLWLTWLRGIIFAVTALVLLPLMVRAFGDPVWLGILFGSMLAALVATFSYGFVAWITEPLENSIPHDCRTIRGFVLKLVYLNTSVSSNKDEWTDERIWQALEETIAKETGSTPEKINPQSNIRDICGD